LFHHLAIVDLYTNLILCFNSRGASPKNAALISASALPGMPKKLIYKKAGT